jgi:hypothetical protein
MMRWRITAQEVGRSEMLHRWNRADCPWAAEFLKHLLLQANASIRRQFSRLIA